MARALWSGSINFSLVNVPVKLYSAVSPKSVHFNMIRKSDASRIKYKKVSAVDGKEVPDTEILKGYEVSPDHYVALTPEELESLNPEQSHAIAIQRFVKSSELECLYFENFYYLGPDKNAASAYALLNTVLTETGKVAIAKMIFHDKEHVVAIRPRQNALTLATVYYADEINPVKDIEGLPTEKNQPGKSEITVAKDLIDALSGHFKLEEFTDVYRERVLKLIDQKASGKKIAVSPHENKSPTNVLDLMDALKASLAASGKKKGAAATTKKAKPEAAHPERKRLKKSA